MNMFVHRACISRTRLFDRGAGGTNKKTKGSRASLAATVPSKLRIDKILFVASKQAVT